MDGIDIPAYFWGIAAIALCLLASPALDRTRPRHRIIVSGAAICATVAYLSWRVLATLDFSTPARAALGIGFLGFEIAATIGGIFVLVIMTRHGDRTAEVAANLDWLHRRRPSAAIFIASYNEDVAILERTITGALNQRYPAKVYLLDDGRRPQVEDLCRRRGVEWLTRPDNSHAKAGNMNAGLRTLAARGALPDFIAILDADFIALPDFMLRSLTLFRDPWIGVVQTPQHFFNPDPLQHRMKSHLDLPDEQRFFFDTLLPAKDGWGTAFSCGTSSVVRTSALTEIGGFPTESITEDMLLSIRMKRRGYITAYLNEKLSLGLAPEGIGEYCTQRVRWCVGAMQIMRDRDGLFSRDDVPFLDRLSMADTLLYWAGSFPFRLLCLLAPIVYWFTGVTVMDASLDALLTFLLPRIVIEAFAISWYTNGRIIPLLTDASQLLIAPEITLASLHTLLFPGERPFKVTAKGGERNQTVVHWNMLLRFAAVLVLTTLGMLISYLTPFSPTFFSDQKGMVAFWSVYNVLVCIICMIVSIETPRRSEERAEIGGYGVFERAGRRDAIPLLDISASGIAFVNLGNFAHGDGGTVHVDEIGSFPAQVVRLTDQLVGARIDLSAEQLVALTTFQFSGHRMRTAQIASMSSLFALLRGLGKT
jgi:cellulose synthase (UDP-forming)